MSKKMICYVFGSLHGNADKQINFTVEGITYAHGFLYKTLIFIIALFNELER